MSFIVKLLIAKASRGRGTIVPGVFQDAGRLECRLTRDEVNRSDPPRSENGRGTVQCVSRTPILQYFLKLFLCSFLYGKSRNITDFSCVT